MVVVLLALLPQEGDTIDFVRAGDVGPYERPLSMDGVGWQWAVAVKDGDSVKVYLGDWFTPFRRVSLSLGGRITGFPKISYLETESTALVVWREEEGGYPYLAVAFVTPDTVVPYALGVDARAWYPLILSPNATYVFYEDSSGIWMHRYLKRQRKFTWRRFITDSITLERVYYAPDGFVYLFGMMQDSSYAYVRFYISDTFDVAHYRIQFVRLVNPIGMEDWGVVCRKVFQADFSWLPEGGAFYVAASDDPEDSVAHYIFWGDRYRIYLSNLFERRESIYNIAGVWWIYDYNGDTHPAHFSPPSNRLIASKSPHPLAALRVRV